MSYADEATRATKPRGLKGKAGSIVYVREVRDGEIPEGVAPEGVQLFSIHSDAGERLALTNDRRAAFSIARQHKRVPVSVH